MSFNSAHDETGPDASEPRAGVDPARESAIRSAVEWLREFLMQNGSGAPVPIASIAARFPHGGALLYEAIGFLDRERRLTVSFDGVVVVPAADNGVARPREPKDVLPRPERPSYLRRPMRFEPSPLPGVLVVEPVVHRDERGFFLETWHARKYAEGGIVGPFVQDNHSRSRKGILRGLHAQATKPQGKLVRVIEGAVFDVAVDIRRGSPTFGRWFGVELTAENFRQMWIPPGFAHGFYVMSDHAQVEYKCTEFYDAKDEIGILWNDPDIGIAWPDPNPTLSPKDAGAPRLKDVARRD